MRNIFTHSDCNYPDPSFSDVTATLALYLLDGALERSCVWIDYKNDGCLDCARNRAYHLEVYLNQRPGGNPTRSFGDGDHEPNYEITTLSNGLNCNGLAWLDYEGDGFLAASLRITITESIFWRTQGIAPATSPMLRQIRML
ncbi:MAG: hypothetical protein MK081_12065 [Flavobacteriales bacterium]|nr:hypothetical protein [Flavobacteriales bacterium]